MVILILIHNSLLNDPINEFKVKFISLQKVYKNLIRSYAFTNLSNKFNEPNHKYTNY